MAKYVDYMEVSRTVKRASGCLAELAEVKTGTEKRECWEAFLIAWISAVDKLIDYADAESETRALGQKLSKVIKDRDRALAYCRVSRNMAYHGLAPPLKLVGSTTVLAKGAVRAEGSVTNVRIGSMTINGELVGEGIELDTADGVPLKVTGMKNPDDVQHEYDDVELADFVTEPSGRRHPRPVDLKGEPLEATDCHALGAYALKWLKDALDEVQAKLR